MAWSRALASERCDYAIWRAYEKSDRYHLDAREARKPLSAIGSEL